MPSFWTKPSAPEPESESAAVESATPESESAAVDNKEEEQPAVWTRGSDGSQHTGNPIEMAFRNM